MTPQLKVKYLPLIFLTKFSIIFISIMSGYEDRMLSNPHYRSSLSGLQQSAKVLRVFFCKCETCCRSSTSRDQIPRHKSFIAGFKPVPVSRINLGSSIASDIHASIEPTKLNEISYWLENSGKRCLDDLANKHLLDSCFLYNPKHVMTIC